MINGKYAVEFLNIYGQLFQWSLENMLLGFLNIFGPLFKWSLENMLSCLLNTFGLLFQWSLVFLNIVRLIIGFPMANVPHIPNFRSLGCHHGLGEAPVVYQLVPGHLGHVYQPQHWLSFGQLYIQIKVQMLIWLFWPTFDKSEKKKKRTNTRPCSALRRRR